MSGDPCARCAVLEAELAAANERIAEMTANRRRLVESSTASIGIIQRIAALAKTRPAETVEASIERLVASRDAALAALDKAEEGIGDD